VALHLWTRETEEGTGPSDPATVRAPEPLGDRILTALQDVRARLTLPAIATSAGAGIITLQFGGDTAATQLTTAVAAIAVGTCVAVAFLCTGSRRLAWAAVALGSALWSVGMASQPVWEATRSDGAVPSSIAGVASVLAVVCLLVGILLHVEVPKQRVARARYLAEGSMLTASIFFASWVIVMPPAFDAVDGLEQADQIRLLAYPIGDVILLAAVVFALTRLPRRGRWSVFLFAGVGAIALLSSAASNLLDSQSTQAQAIDLGMSFAFGAIIVAAIRSGGSEADVVLSPVPERAQLLLLATPGLSVLIVVGTTLRQVIGKPVAVELTWITIGVLSLSVLLHLTVIYENHALSRDLALARDEAIRASELKSSFLANVSHEIRTPMNAVIGLTGLLLDSELDEDQRELATGVSTSAEGLLGLIDAVLDFSKIEAEKLDLEEIDLDIEDLIDDVAMLVGDSARRKGIELFAYCEPGMETMRRGDPVRIRQILINLANNAVKFTEKGSVTIQAMPGDDPEQVAFLVIDTGIGIPESEQARLFEPFSQLDESTTRKFGGTGLGLGIVMGLVELQEGTIELASEVGVGTVFRVTLPLRHGAKRTTEKGLTGLVGLRALLVDPNAVNRSVIAHSLQNWGFIVDQASSADEALHRYSWSGLGGPGYALVVLEHRLDDIDIDGVELARLLRAQEATSSSVILLLSSAVNLSRQDAHEAGIASVLVKPVRNSYLLRRIVDSLITTPTPRSPAGTQQKEAQRGERAPSPAR
jgi:signal transduction histidine kinase/FixJ family two-component response regulator